MKGTISKPVIAIAITGVALMTYVVWHGLSRHERANLEEAPAPPTGAADATANAAPTRGSSLPAPQATVLTAPVPLPLTVAKRFA